MWAAHLGPGASGALARLLGREGKIHTGEGWALGLCPNDPDRPRLEAGADGQVALSVEVNGTRETALLLDLGGPTLTVTRDLFGLRSVSTAHDGDDFWCASDLSALATLSGVSRPLDPLALHGYLCFSYVPAPRAILGGIAVLPAGGQLTAGSEGTRSSIDDPWQEAETGAANQEEAATALRRRLRDAVERRLGTEPIGVFLSGGLDSSLIAALLVETGARVHLFTLDFGPPHDAELPTARQVAAHLGCPLHVVPARPAGVRAVLEATAAALEQPFGDGVTAPLTLLGRAAAEEVEVVFNGEGGDQLFGGWANKPMVAAEIYGTGEYDRLAAYLATYHRFYGQTERQSTPPPPARRRGRPTCAAGSARRSWRGSMSACSTGCAPPTCA
jgi:asparagine synthase (glutamine-hydrolysing)